MPGRGVLPRRLHDRGRRGRAAARRSPSLRPRTRRRVRVGHDRPRRHLHRERRREPRTAARRGSRSAASTPSRSCVDAGRGRTRQSVREGRRRTRRSTRRRTSMPRPTTAATSPEVCAVRAVAAGSGAREVSVEEPSTSRTISVEVNGDVYEREVDARRLLVHFIRDDLDLTGTHVGCDTGNCGACTVHLDGQAVKSCMLLAVQADGAKIETVEGLATGDGELSPLQQSFSAHHALQCGYCTPGMLMSASALLAQNPHPSEDEARTRDPGQHLPLHRLREHRRGDRVGAERRHEHDRDDDAPRPVELQKGHIGQSIPRKEDRRLVQGQGVFFDDVRRHGMGYVHFVRSPYAHAKIVSIDVSAALELDGVYGTLTGDEVAIQTDPFFEMSVAARREHQGLRARRRQGALHGRAGGRGLRQDARARARRRRARRGRVRAARRARRRARGGQGRDRDARRGRLERRLERRLRLGRLGGGEGRGRPRSSRSTSCTSTASARRRSSARARSSSTRRAPASGRSTATTRCPASARSGWRRRCAPGSTSSASSPTTSAAASATRSACTRTTSTLCLLARKLNRPVNWTEWRTDQHTANAHGNERWFHDVEVAVKADGTMLGFNVKALDDCGAFPRYEPLGCIIWAQVTPGLLRLAEHPRRLHAGRRRTSRRSRRTAATRGCSTSG